MVNLLLALGACATSRPLAPTAAQQRLADAWHADHHAVWELNWSAVPLGGPVTVETWQAGPRYRYEILEAPAPTLVGQSLVFDGQTAWRYNRLEPPAVFEPASPALAPVTELFAQIERLLATPAESAAQNGAHIDGRAALQTRLVFASGDTLVMWQATDTGLPLKVELQTGAQTASLRARTVEPLPNPPPELFSVGDWLRDIP